VPKNDDLTMDVFQENYKIIVLILKDTIAGL